MLMAETLQVNHDPRRRRRPGVFQNVRLNERQRAVVLPAIPPDPSLSPEACTRRLRSLAENFGGEFTGYGGSEQVVLRGAFPNAGAAQGSFRMAGVRVG